MALAKDVDYPRCEDQKIQKIKTNNKLRRLKQIMKTLNIEVTFLQGLLGTQTGDKDVYRSFIGSKAPDAQKLEEEIEAIGKDNVVDKGKTFFPRTKDGKPFIYDYQLKGFFKSACSALSKVKGTLSSQLKAFKKHIDLRVFVEGRENVIENYSEITECQRPLRCQTMQGERISLAISEEIAAGATCKFKIVMLCDEDLPLIKEWLDYGKFNGLLQWRNSGKGSFNWREI